MDETNVKKALSEAIGNLFEKQPNIFEFTSETGQTEWNLAHHLANEIHAYFPEFDCDLDLIKVNYDRRRPDIVIHKRGTNSSNFLVIEVKRDGDQRSMSDDVEKIKSNWFRGNLNYQFGAVVNLLNDKSSQVEVFKNR
jgi:hypothetical protein